MSSSFDLKIYTPEEVVFNEKAVQLTASNSTGEFGILPGHTFFSSDIVPCNLIVKSESGPDKKFKAGFGLISVKSNEVIVALESAVVD